MERLTFEGNFCDIAGCQTMPCIGKDKCRFRQIWERLKEYEDAGLSPAACAQARRIEDRLNEGGGSIKTMVELMVAYDEGRIVVLPNSEARPVARDDGKVYASIAQAAADNGTARSKISAVCNGKRTSVKGHRFRALTSAEMKGEEI